MNKSRSYKNQNFRAQAIMEFTLALPILLLLVYGVLETGRLLFIYSSTITAARQAARYGSATGDSPNGMPYYNDCAGIAAAAQKTGFINTFESINISYDKGLDSTGNPVSPIANCGSLTPVNGDRVVVEVTTQWQPIVPIVPLKAFTIKSQSERTIFASISIAVTALPQGFVSPTPTKTSSPTPTSTITPTPTQTLTPTATIATQPLTLNVTIDNPEPLYADNLITYTYTLSNPTASQITGVSLSITGNGTVTLTGNCSSTINANSQITCTGTRIVSQMEIDLGASFTNTATAYKDSTVLSNSRTTTFSSTQIKAISIASFSATISAPPLVAGISTIHYVYTLKNTGNVTLQNPTVSDDKATITCPSGALPPYIPTNITITCSGDHTLSQLLDIDTGVVKNTGIAMAIFGDIEISPSNPVNQTVYTYIGPRFSVTVSGSPNPITQAGNITFTYTITNTGSTNLVSQYSISTSGTGSSPVSCAFASTNLAPGASTTCTSIKQVSTSGSYTVTVTAATASGTGGSINATTPLPSTTVTAPFCTIQNLTLDMSNDDFKGSKLIQQWVITNNTGAPLHIDYLEFNWSSSGNSDKTLISARISQSTQTIWSWSGSDISGYFRSESFRPSGGLTIVNSSDNPIKLTLKFLDNVTVTGLKIYFIENQCHLP